MIIQSQKCIAQSHTIKFFVVPFLYVNTLSLTYEYSFNIHNSIGVHNNVTLINGFIGSYTTIGSSIYYRYYINFKNKKHRFYFQPEVRYYRLSTIEYESDLQDPLRSDNYTLGFLIGPNTYFGKSRHMFFEFGIGLNAGPRKYVGDGRWAIRESDGSHYFNKNPDDKFSIVPRVVLEIGYRF